MRQISSCIQRRPEPKAQMGTMVCRNGEHSSSSSSSRAVLVLSIWLPTLLLVELAPAVAETPTSPTPIPTPTPTPWPLQFHSILYVNYSGSLSLIDLWYDWPNGRNFNIIQDQLDVLSYDVEWNNGTSFFYTLDPKKQECRSVQLEVGILRPSWLDGANYMGQRYVDGFLCNVWDKVDFIWYYEDVATKRPVHWIFYTGRSIHVMTFEVGAVLEDSKWQAPVYCFQNKNGENSDISVADSGVLGAAAARRIWDRIR